MNERVGATILKDPPGGPSRAPKVFAKGSALTRGAPHLLRHISYAEHLRILQFLRLVTRFLQVFSKYTAFLLHNEAVGDMLGVQFLCRKYDRLCEGHVTIPQLQ